MVTLFISLCCVLYFDARFLSRKNPELYRRTIEYPSVRWAIYGTLLCPAMLPIYLLRRRKYVKEGAGFDSNETLLADLLEVLLTWFCGIALFVLAMKLVVLAVPGLHGSLLSVLLVSAFSSCWMVWLIARLPRRPGRPAFASLIAAHKPQSSAFKTYVIAALIGIVFAAVSAYIMQARVQRPSTPLGDALQANESSLALVLFITLGLGLAPLLEEFMFRGYFFTVLQRLRGTPLAIAVIAGLFALLHVGQYWGDWLAILMVTLLGLEITLLRAWSGSVIPGIVTHYFYNTLVSILPAIFLFLSNPAYVKYVTEYPRLSAAAKEELLRDSIETHPDFAESYNDLAWLYAENGNHLEEALKLVEEALYRQPDNPAFLDTKAEILFRLGRTQDAVAIERKLTQKFPATGYYKEQLKKFSAPASR